MIVCLSTVGKADETRVILVDELPVTLLNREAKTPKPIFERDSVYLPVRRAGNLILVEAEADGMKGYFILDLGAPYLVLNETYFRDYRVDDRYMTASLTSTATEVKRTDVESLRISSVNYSKLTADVTDLSAIEDKRGIQILGLLGVNLFKSFTLDIDVLAQSVGLFANGRKPRIAEDPTFLTEVRLASNVITFPVEVNGKRVKMSLDSGAEFNVLHNSLNKKIFEDMEIMQTFSVTGSDSRSADVLMARMDGMTLEGFGLRKMTTLIYDMSALREVYGLGVLGMLGYPFLCQGRVVLDFREKTMEFYKMR
jgi:hypothetical protein